MKLLELFFYAACVTCFSMHAAAPNPSPDSISRVDFASAQQHINNGDLVEALTLAGNNAVPMQRCFLDPASQLSCMLPAAPLVHTYNHMLTPMSIFAARVFDQAFLKSLDAIFGANQMGNPQLETYITIIGSGKNRVNEPLLFRPQYIFLPQYNKGTDLVQHGNCEFRLYENGQWNALSNLDTDFLIHPKDGNPTAFSPDEPNRLKYQDGRELLHDPSISRVICYRAVIGGRTIQGMVLLLNSADWNRISGLWTNQNYAINWEAVITLGNIVNAMSTFAGGIQTALFGPAQGLLTPFMPQLPAPAAAAPAPAPAAAPAAPVRRTRLVVRTVPLK